MFLGVAFKEEDSATLSIVNLPAAACPTVLDGNRTAATATFDLLLLSSLIDGTFPTWVPSKIAV